MTIYRIEIELLSPMIISHPQPGRVLRGEYRYIPSTTIKGAILSMLYREYGASVHEESLNPRICIHPGYPIFDGYEARYAHPLIYKCKVCRDGENIIVDKSILDPDGLGRFNLERLEPPYKCGRGHIYAISPLKNTLLILRDGVYHPVEVETTSLDSIGINRYLGSTEHGMLYTYIVVAPGVKYGSMIYDPDDRLEGYGLTEGTHRINIGRGISRGLGLARLRVERHDEYLSERVKEIMEYLELMGEYIILRAKSPLSPYLGLRSQPWDLEGFIGHDIGGGILIPNGPPLKVRGYSSYTNQPKLSIMAYPPGTLVFYKTGDRMDRVAEKLARMELGGFYPPYNIGLNLMEVYTDANRIRL